MRWSFTTASGRGTGRESAMGKGCGTVFFGLFFLMGALFTTFILVETWRQVAPWLWTETDCTILSSEVVETGDDQQPYRASIRFRYEVGGRTFESESIARGDAATASFDRARDTAARYPPRASAACWVNPNQPSQAVLQRRLPWIACVVFFPLIFVVIGGGGLYLTWRHARPGDGASVESISQTAARGRGHRAMVLFGLLFVIVGCGVFVPLAVLPGIRFVASLGWQQTPCTIVDSRLRSWSTDDGTSYRADILYRYQAGGREWTSNRVVFFGVLHSGFDSARAMLDRHPEGATDQCWVDPRDPSRSVLERRLRALHLVALTPLIFVLAGAAVMRFGLKRLRASPVELDAVTDETLAEGSSLQLEPAVGPAGKLLGTVLFTAIWNGIVSVFAWQAVKAWQTGRPDWSLMVFLTPFVLIGLASVGIVAYFVLALANPRPRLTLTPGRPRLGETLSLQWSFSGRSGRLDNLRIFLEGREEATYRRGTDTYTDREVFATIDLVDTPSDWEIPRGTAEVSIPEDTMHSFDGDSNKIVWEIKVSGAIDRWPDVNQSFPVTVRPMRIEVV